MKTLTAKGPVDNFLLEMELALQYNAERNMAIYPLLVGSQALDEHGRKVFRPLSGDVFQLDGIPTTASPTSRASPHDTLKRLFKFQGLLMKKAFLDKEELDDIVRWSYDFAWTTKHKDSLGVGWMSLSCYLDTAAATTLDGTEGQPELSV